jgi:N-formylmaleamate deformylase
MLNLNEDNFKTGGINIHYYHTGGNEPMIIMLHGATDNGLCWTPVAENLTPDYGVVMPDAQGHGLSDRLDAEFQFANHAAQVIGLVNHLGIAAPVIMGHSMGAGTAVNVAVKEPRLPKAIILEDPAWMPPEPAGGINEEALKQREAFVKRLAGYREHTLEDVIAEGRKENPRWSEAEIVPWAKAKTQFDPTLFSRLQLDSPTYEELVPQIQCPTLLITSDGGLVSADVARNALKLWKSTKPFRWVRIEGAGHNIRREQFEAFIEAVNRFLQEIS